MFIRTNRMLLRPSWPDDIDELLALINDEPVLWNVALEPWPTTRHEARDLIERPRDALLPHFFINLRTDHGAELIGSIGLGNSGDDVEIGYWIARPHWGCGYACEAVSAVLDQARTLGHRRIVACHFADSHASARVLEKNGFVRQNEKRHRYSVGRSGDCDAVLYCADLERAGTRTAYAGASVESGMTC